MEELGRALCIITGASRGFGRTIAKEVSRVVKPGSVFVLVARSGDDLRALQKEMAESDLVVRVVVADLSSMEAVENVTRTAKEAFQEDIQHVILFNNAGCLGDVSRYSSSFTSMAEAFPKQPGLRRCVVNISSLCALKPFPSWVLYCTGKAARDMMFKVLAEENPDLRVLNYAPGPLDTDMQLVIRTQTAEVTIRQTFADMSAQGQLLTCEASCAKLIKLLQEDKYKSGDHIDVYDV
ncbi:sepiapterin reductase a isoform X2 [Nerophis lumbriciformis]|uniref:sepiapterin reductase a isoform X2 n=1 Tax=Nerophis lumbriciformis TaxID=546530 RepID=UPI002AE05D28|nr:sepiapterin reductase-like isoform X2 [Nerophis lumbriciformis]